ncbi:HlyD family secretion protein [Daejeonella rubra]|uniref:HlyD family secretion protein n=1 Tax=Daejeonella rubra TaxID=990371 RepID=A0A1G9TM93_9SPHI|nr:HlyD family efflux transporter periplasmic adaptor subunit [Daejeonella rubra]SDM48772.1 HlyD family secretion protein [Daejeonella rubra]
MALSVLNNESLASLSLSHKFRSGKFSSIIYVLAILATFSALLLLPFISVQISVKSPGIIQSSIEKTELFTSVSGRVIDVRMKDNQQILRGDTVLILDSSVPGQKSDLLGGRKRQLEDFLADIEKLLLVSDKTEEQGAEPLFKSTQYFTVWRHFSQEVLEIRNVKDQAEKIFSRYKILYQNNAITLSEYEKFSFDYDQANSNHSLLIKRYKSQWEQDAVAYRNELREIAGTELEITDQKSLYVIKAPVDGSLQDLQGLQEGSYVFANQRLAEISPDTKLTAFCYVKPSDIGLITEGQSVSFQVDAFNYNQWGMISGKVLDISDDIILSDGGVPVFKVKCSLDSGHLRSGADKKGYVRKGMGFTARFIVAERTLIQLLYDNVDDWLNPNLTNRGSLQ